MFDGNLALKVIYDTLNDDATLSALHNGIVEDIWGKDDEAPTEAYPFIAISVMDQMDNYFNGRARAFSYNVVLVRAIQQFTDNASYGGTLESIADRIDTLLHGKTLDIYDDDDKVGHATIWRERAYRERYPESGIEYRHLGGIYQVTTTEI